MKTIDLNADIGEATDQIGQQAELAILQYISSANIACGGHAGNDGSMLRTVRAAIENDVTIGAHPAYPDPANFGRKSIGLENARLSRMLKDSLKEQTIRLIEIAADEGATVKYVKPHGALYNDAVKSAAHANLIAEAIYEVSPDLIFLGGPDSEMTKAAHRTGLEFISEGFVDRRYTDNGHLQSRSIEGAVIASQSDRLEQAVSLARYGVVTTATGNTLCIHAQSLCLHGDSHGAAETASRVRKAIVDAGVDIKSFANAC